MYQYVRHLHMCVTEQFRMIEFLVDNIFVECSGVIFQQVIGIPMGTNCAPLLADLFLYSYEAEFIQTLIKSGKQHLAKSFHYTYRYIDDVLSINNPKFGSYIVDIYPAELEIKDTTDADHRASYSAYYYYYGSPGFCTSIFDLMRNLYIRPEHLVLPFLQCALLFERSICYAFSTEFGTSTDYSFD